MMYYNLSVYICLYPNHEGWDPVLFFFIIYFITLALSIISTVKHAQ